MHDISMWTVGLLYSDTRNVVYFRVVMRDDRRIQIKLEFVDEKLSMSDRTSEWAEFYVPLDP